MPRHPVQPRRADDVHAVVRRERHASHRRPVAVAVAVRVVRTVWRQQAVIEIGKKDRVVPDETLEVIGEPRSIPADAEHALWFCP